MELEGISGCQVAPAASGSSSHVPGSVPEDGLHGTSYSRSLQTPHLPRHRGNSGWHSVAWTNCLVIHLAGRSLEPGWRSKVTKIGYPCAPINRDFGKLSFTSGLGYSDVSVMVQTSFGTSWALKMTMALFPDGTGSSGKH